MTILKSLAGTKDLGFGQYYCQRMMISSFDGHKWSELALKPTEAISLHPGAKTLHYGQEIFEGLKAFRTARGDIHLFRPQENIRRMTRSAEIMAMVPFPEAAFLDGVVKLVTELREMVPEEPGALYLRPTMIGTSSNLGVAPSKEYLFYILASPVGGYFGDVRSDTPAGVSVWIDTQHVRAVRGGLGAAKTGANYAASLRSVAEAKARGFHNVLFLDAIERKFVEELSGMNVFIVEEGRIKTPPLGDTILAGITRDSILKVAKRLDLVATEEAIDIHSLLKRIEKGDPIEMFACGTGASITCIRELGWQDRRILLNEGKAGPVSCRLYKELLDIQYARKAAPEKDWIVQADRV